jgi:pilin isopeptide linkage protein/LPXTG-motif cell wall-anchored protein
LDTDPADPQQSPEDESGTDGVPVAIDEDGDETVTTSNTQPVTYGMTTYTFEGKVQLLSESLIQPTDFQFMLRLDEESHPVVGEDGTETWQSVEQNGVGFVKLAGYGGATVKEANTYHEFTISQTYKEPGIYSYSLYAVNLSSGNIDYDEHSYKVTIQVEPDEDNVLHATVASEESSANFDHMLKSTGDTEETKEPEDTEPASTTATIQGYKVLKGRDMTAGEFQIGLRMVWTNADLEVNLPKADVDVSGPKVDTGDGDGFSAEVDDEQEAENTVLKSSADDTQTADTAEIGSVAAGTEGQAVPVSFTETYTKAGAYVYEMYEVDTDVGGIIYDTHVCTVQVIVTLNQDGTLTASDPEYVGSSTFTNWVASKESVTVSIGGYKVLVGRDMQENEEFTFGLEATTVKLTETDQTETTEENSALESGMENLSIHTKSTSGLSSSAVVTTTVKGAKNGIPKAFAFPEITYYEPGTYTYSMYEIPGSDDDLIYDTSPCTVVVTVTRTDAGTLAAEVEYEDTDNNEVYFANRFNGLTLTLGGSKTLIGAEMAENEFTFGLDNVGSKTVLYAGDDFKLNDALDTSSSVQTVKKARAVTTASLLTFSSTTEGSPAAADGAKATFTFPELTFTEPGTYQFRMYEQNDGLENIIYDSHVCTITVTVNADFSYSISYDGSTSFVNQVQKPGTDGYDTATAVITGTKTLFGRDMEDGETFDFTLTPKFSMSDYGVSVVNQTEDLDAEFNNLPTRKARAKAPASTSEATISTTVLNASVSGAKDGQPVAVSFGELQFTEPGTYHFDMAETQGDSEDIAYDSHTCAVTVVVAENSEGLLHAQVTYEGGNTFENYVNSGATVTLTGTKTLYGRDMIDGEFQFDLTEVSYSSGNNLPTIRLIDLDDTETETETDSTKVLDHASAPAAAAGEKVSFAFQPITYTKPGTYKYTIEENQGMDDVEYDDRVYYVEVHVITTDAGLKVDSVTYEDDYGNVSEQADFVNYAGSYVDIQAEKRLIGRDMENYEFQFTMTYTGFTRTKAVVVKKIETSDGKLISESSNVLPQGVDEAYPKQIVGYSTAAKADAYSDIHFDWASFDQPGCYYYVLSEVQGDDPDITYDDTQYVVVVTVTESGTAGMTNTVQYYKVTDNAWVSCEKPSFTNVAQTVTADLTCTKTLIGRNMENNEFSFGLYLISEPAHYNNLPTSKAIDLDQDHSYVSIATVGEGSDGQAVDFTFKNVKLTRAGTYVFGVEELYNFDPTICYDTHEGIITVTVGRDTDNKLTVTDILYSDTDFVNMAGASVDLQASKTMVGRDMTKGEFSFTVTPAKSYTNVKVVTEDLKNEAILNRKGQWNNIDETIAAITRNSESELRGTFPTSGAAYAGTTVQNPAAKADTKTVFNLETLTFTKPGTYTFTIQENQGKDTGVLYDSNVWTATVVVAKDMTATVTYTDSQGNTADQADFTNSAQAKLELIASKTLYGRDMTAGEFSFTVGPKDFTYGDSSGVYVIEGSSTVLGPRGEDGRDSMFSLGAYTFTKPGDYTFEAQEVIPQDTGDIIYDTSVWEITVHVEKTNTGLVAYADYLDTEINQTETWAVFENFYKCPQVTITGTKTLLGRNMQENEFSFALTLVSEPTRYNNLPTTKAIGLDDDLDDAMAIDMNDELDDDAAETNTTTLQQVSVGAGNAGKAVAFSFAPITFSRAGEYIFEVQEITGSAANVTYDTHVATIIAEVGRDTDGNLTITSLTETEMDFVNSYEAPYTPSITVKPTKPEVTEQPDEPATVDDTPEEPAVSEEPTQPETPTASEEPTQPEGPTITVGPEDSLEDGNAGTGLDKPQEEQPNETAPETTVKPSVAPQTTSSTSLPQTGQDWWPVLLLAAVGVLLIAAGVFHGKKRNI